MASLFGEGSPSIYLPGGDNFALPETVRDGKYQNFLPEVRRRVDFKHVVHERYLGYRLRCEFRWPTISAENRENILRLVNCRGQKWIKFTSFPRRYPVYVESFSPGLRAGYDDKDSIELVLVGTHLVLRYPSIDQIYILSQPYNRYLNTT